MHPLLPLALLALAVPGDPKSAGAAPTVDPIARLAPGLAGLGPELAGLAPDALAARALHDRSAEVRARAALALREAADPQAAERLAAGLASPLAGVRHAALEALGTLGGERSLAVLAAHLGAARAAASELARAPRSNLAVTRQTAYVRDYDVEIAQAASIAKPIVGVVTDGAVLDVGVRGVGVSARELRAELAASCRALARASGEKHGANADAWLAWWKARETARAVPPASTTTGACPVTSRER